MTNHLARPLAAVATAAALLLGGVTGTAAPAEALGPKPTGPTAVSVLNTLPVKGKAAKSGYSRAKFGQGWKDPDRNGCDSRNDILRRDLTKDRFKAGTGGCVLASGTLKDPYTGRTISHVRGGNKVDIDHVVALGQAWVSGAQKLSAAQRTAFANDPLNLLAVDASANRAKGDREASAWLPKNKAFRCTYVATQIAVKKKYALSVTSAEKSAMKRVLTSCPKQKTVKITPVRPAGKTPAPVKTPAKSTSLATTVKGVHPGAYCAAAAKGYKGISTAGKTYTCKTSPTDSRLRWRA
ncbi:HNH endonuclease family protein [Arthrobacter sp. GCM10027362]